MSTGKVRIIGGHWRGRMINVLDQSDLRPTADRVRETLFNWLGQRLDDLTCLDMFSGTGVIGFEALSRGAKLVTMVELNKAAYLKLKNNFSQFKDASELGNLVIIHGDAISYSATLPEDSVDITFIDPPFSNQSLFLSALTHAVRITNRDAASAIYIEHPKTVVPEDLLKQLPKYGDLWEIGRTIRSGMANGTLLVPKKI